MKTKQHIFGALFFCTLIVCISSPSTCQISSSNDSSPQLVVPVGHTQRLAEVSFSPNGKYILTGGGQTAQLWETKTGRLVHSLGGHQVMIWQAKFDKSGKYILTTSIMEMKLWKTSTGELIDSYDVDFKKQNIRLFFQSFQFDGKYLDTFNENNSGISWSTKPLKPITGIEVPQLLPPPSLMTNEDRILLKNYNKIQKDSILFDHKRQLLGELNLEAHERQLSSYKHVILSETSKYNWFFAAVTSDSLVRIWNVLHKTMVYEKKCKRELNWIKFSPTGKYLLWGDFGFSATLVNSETGEEESVFSKSTGTFSTGNFSPDGQYLLSTGNGKPEVFEVNTGKTVAMLDKYSSGSFAGSFSPDNQYILAEHNNKEIGVWQMKNGIHLYSIKSHASPLERAILSPNQKYLVTWSILFFNQKKHNNIKIWDANQGKIIHSFEGGTWFSPQLSPDGNSLVYGIDYKKVVLLNIETSQKDTLKSSFRGSFKSVFFSKDGKSIISVNDDGVIYFWDIKTSIEKAAISVYHKKIEDAFFNDNGDILFAAFEDDTIRMWSYPELKFLKGFPIPQTSNNKISQNGKYITYAGANDSFGVIDVKRGREVFKNDSLRLVHDIAFSPNNKYVVTVGRNDTTTIMKTKSGEILHQLKTHSGWITQLDISPNSKYLATGGLDNSICVLDIKSGQLLYRLLGHTGEIKSLQFNKDNKRIISGSSDGTCKIWDVTSGQEICTLIGIDNYDFICSTPDNYFYGSKDATKYLNWKVDITLFQFEQFDLIYNRPDLVLKQIGGDVQLQEAYHKAYLKRLKRQGFNEKNIRTQFHQPEFLILNKADIPLTVAKRKLKLNIQAEDDKFLLDRINVWINGTPIFGLKGIDLKKEKTQKYRNEFIIELSSGTNQVEVSAHNQAGIESFKESFKVFFDTTSIKPNLYLIAIGDQKDLSFPNKDAQDILDLFDSNKNNFNEIIPKKLINEQVTVQEIMGLGDWLKSARIDDVVILFYAGHGLLDDEFNYFLATHNVDLLNPKNNGLAYDDLLKLLNNIKARKKLLLLDACHSGDLDTQDLKLVKEFNQNSEELIFRTLGNKNKIISTEMDGQNSFDLMKSLFVDLEKGTGTTVLSSTRGVDYALESSKWNNGVFTYFLKKSLEKGAADLNADGQIMVSEWIDYVKQEVVQETNGIQVPNARVENIYNDFRIW